MNTLFWCIGIFIFCQLFLNWYNDMEVKRLKKKIKDLENKLKDIQP